VLFRSLIVNGWQTVQMSVSLPSWFCFGFTAYVSYYMTLKKREDNEEEVMMENSLTSAACRGEIDQIVKLVTEGADMNQIDSEGCTPAACNEKRLVITVPKVVTKSHLYTKGGDTGNSYLYNCEIRGKTDPVFHVLGDIDELNAVIGISREYCAIALNGLEDILTEIEWELFDLGAAVATPLQSSSMEKKKYTEFSGQYTSQLENWIDALDCCCPPLTNFIIPSGGLCSTHLNLARAVCRRAERAVVPLVQSEDVDSEVGKYLNRLSDFLFVASRFVALKEGRTEELFLKTFERPKIPVPTYTP